jgi:phage tail protein X
VESLLRSLRLMVGLGMIAAGSALVAPAAVEAVSWWQAWQTARNRAAEPEPAWMRGELQGGISSGCQQQPGPAAMPPVNGAVSAPLGHVPPPPPPEPLPAVPRQLAAAAPGLPAHYRSTVETPPPPLLDGQAAPPLAVGWTTRQPPARPAPAVGTEPVRIYIVRDGDDLTAIATRFYGHPAAAAAIWQANRGLLRDPAVLPIGAALVLPPPAVAMGGGDGTAVEPALSTHHSAPPARPAQAASWLFGPGVSGFGRSTP